MTFSQPIRWMLVSVFAFAATHALVKGLPRLPVHEIVTVRAAFSLVFTLYFLKREAISPWGHHRTLLLTRGIVGTIALALYFYTLQKMPLATAVTIQYLHPLLTVVLARFFFAESPSVRQALGLLGGLIGVVIVQGVDDRVTAMDATIGVISAVFSALAYNMIRGSNNKEHPLVVMFYLPLVSLVALGPWTAVHFVPPTFAEWGLLALVGAFTQLAQYYMTKAYQGDKAARVSSMNYLGVIYGALIGWLVFGESLEWSTVAGMILITASAIGGSSDPHSTPPPRTTKYSV